VALRQEELTGLCDDVDLERDRALVERCQAGDSAAFGNLYARYYERLLRFCLRRLNDRHEAEDAAQEAFARAWKALPRFAGERRFYPWLTVIAGNICTDMLRRRSRSTPTDDMELTARHPVGAEAADTSEELVLAAVDGELVNRALERLSTRHRHVLAMREGSGWTYQQIADHEGVEIGTIETLLWRARQALKREFAVVSESKEALAGFLIAAGALFRRTLFRVAHRGAGVSHQGGGAGGLRNAMAGVAVTGAAVAAAFIAPHALSGGPGTPAPAAGSALAAPPLALGGPASVTGNSVATATGGAASSRTSGGSGTGSSSGIGSAGGGGQLHTGGAAGPVVNATRAGGASGGGVTGGLNQAAGGVGNAVTNVAGGLSQATGGLGNTVTSVAGGLSQATGGLGNTVNNVAGGLGAVTNVTSGLGSTVTNATGGLGSTVNGTTATLGNTLGGVTSGVNNLTQSVGLGSVLPPVASPTSGSPSSVTGSAASAATTTTTAPGLLGGLGNAANNLLGGG
jgi:RNA polymerase sigma-70 factor (ECF subfamily)